jgi:hypothetical protein
MITTENLRKNSGSSLRSLLNAAFAIAGQEMNLFFLCMFKKRNQRFLRDPVFMS